MLTDRYTVKTITGMAEVIVTDSVKGRLCAALTLINKYDQTVVKLYKEGCGDTLLIPRGLVKQSVDLGTWIPAKISFTGVLNSDQETLENGYLEHLRTHNGGIIQSGCGTGKTVMGISIMAKLGLKTLIIVPTDHLMNQWKERLKTFSNLKDYDIGICRGNICDFNNKKVVIGMIHSVCKEGRYHKDFYTDFGLMIVDEVHTLSAPTFSQAAPLFHSKYRLGLSATPRRKDNMQNIFFYHIGQVCLPAPKIKVKPNVVMISYRGKDSTHAGCVWGGELSLGRYLNRVSEIENRNRMLIEIISKMYKKGRSILVLSDRLKQLGVLSSGLQRSKVEKEDIGILTGATKKGLDRRIILATYGSAGLGADIPTLSTVVLATPRVDIEQNIGRILGLRATEAFEPLVIDIVDEASSIMRGWARARTRYYDMVAKKVSYL